MATTWNSALLWHHALFEALVSEMHSILFVPISPAITTFPCGHWEAHPPSRKAATMKAYSQYTPLTRSEDQTAPRKADCEPITLSVAESSSVPVWVASSLSRCLVSALIYWRHDHRCVINSQRYFAFEQYV
jgi:hypothetical protein